MSLGKRCLYFRRTRQWCGSHEAKVGEYNHYLIDQLLPKHIWFKLFKITQNIAERDTITHTRTRSSIIDILINKSYGFIGTMLIFPCAQLPSDSTKLGVNYTETNDLGFHANWMNLCSSWAFIEYRYDAYLWMSRNAEDAGYGFQSDTIILARSFSASTLHEKTSVRVANSSPSSIVPHLTAWSPMKDTHMLRFSLLCSGA